MQTITPTLHLAADDIARILRWGDFAARADEATGINAVSLSRELTERIREAIEDGCKVLYTPPPPEHLGDMNHWELN